MRTCLVLPPLVTALAFSTSSSPVFAGDAQIAILSKSNWDRFAPIGKEVDAIYGDGVLKNDHITAVIAQPLASRNANMTVREVAGMLIDLTVNDSPSDQLSAFYVGRRRYAFREWTLAADGAQLAGQAAVGAGNQVAIVVRAAATDLRPEVETTYQLSAQSRHLEITTRITNRDDKSISVTLEDDLRADSGKEDFSKSPNGVARLFWMHDRYWGQAYGIVAPGYRIQSNSNTRTSVLEYLKDDSDSVELAAGASVVFSRRIFPGENLFDVRATDSSLNSGDGNEAAMLKLRIVDAAGQPVAGGLVELKDDNGILQGAGKTDATGRISAQVQPGDWRVHVTSLGIPVTERNGAQITTVSGKVTQINLKATSFSSGVVSGRITDGHGLPVACKIEFVAPEDAAQPDFGPESADYAVRNLHYAPRGEFEQRVPAGSYEVVVSHGPEFDAVFTKLDVQPGKTAVLNASLTRSVKTPGYISSDFHSHSSPSGDNTGSQFGRVLNLVCEHVEFAPCTEHNRISTYDPHIKRLGIEHAIATVTGMELTGSPLLLNHQNVFPLRHVPRTQDGGAPVTDRDPSAQIERVALWDNRSEKLVQQNHPDLGWLFFDRNGDQKSDSGFERSFPFMDVMEIHPIHAVLQSGRYELREEEPFGNHRILNWLQLLNQGFRIYGVVNTDAHYNFHGSSSLRNWIQSPTDDPAAIDPMDVVHAAEQGRLVMSNGPYLEVTAVDSTSGSTVISGQDLVSGDGIVKLKVRVQCANWVDIDRVFVLINGRKHSTHQYTRATHPKLFGDGVLKFDRELELKLKSDAHVIVVAAHAGRKLGRVVGPFWGLFEPTAISNPIFMDLGGDGFVPNKDTLDHPLPVKFKRP